MEKTVERMMYAARWLLAPIYIGLSLALLALTIKFFQEVVHVLPHVLDLSENDLILAILSFIDMGLVGGLLVMVMFSGYENYVTFPQSTSRRTRSASPGSGSLTRARSKTRWLRRSSPFLRFTSSESSWAFRRLRTTSSSGT